VFGSKQLLIVSHDDALRAETTSAMKGAMRGQMFQSGLTNVDVQGAVETNNVEKLDMRDLNGAALGLVSAQSHRKALCFKI
jgi:hypothetical protein